MGRGRMSAVNIRDATAADAPVIAKMLAHLADDHGVPEVEIGRCRIETSLDPQGTTRLQTLDQLAFNQNLIRAAPDQLQLFFRHFGHLFWVIRSG